MEEIIKILAIAVLVLINGFFTASEFAMVKIRNSRIDTLVAEGSGKAKHAKTVKDNLNSCLSACQLGITLCSLGLGWMGESTITELILPVMKLLGLSESIIHTISFAISFFLVTMIEVVIGELVPKALALYNTETIMLNTSLLLLVFYKIMYPIIFFFNASTNVFLKPFGYSQADEIADPHTGEEIRMLIEESYQSGLIDESEQKLVDNVFDFGDKLVREVMVPRTDMCCIYKDDSEEEVFKIVSEEGFTRFPVCGKDKDDILGFIHIKDLYNQSYTQNKYDLDEITRKILYIPETISISRLLEKLKKDKIQIAIVMDEYGGTSGLVTIEDILEEIVGDIQDEFDEETQEIRKLAEGEYLVKAIVPIDEINEFFNIEIEHEGFDSIGGWLYNKLGASIQVDKTITFENYSFTVSEMDKLRVVSLVVKQLS
ncbi:hemolysin family protein [Inconstantimicrobium mannanitabidum]|uniref:Membrane protein n=1 Tax=Inconstantimicrobium mannanitabidum TaxID=1604901 RepID=A0ACB5R7K7_9CLOT|nr:hemolysin family protein [Clostridium sp. TW13]GKX65012.1 membrane protein [Clostridium sp. TW13]